MFKKKISVFFILLVINTSFAQIRTKEIVKADKFYDCNYYFNSIAIYEKVANKGYKSVELFEKLGNAYYFNSQYVDANKWYTELFALNKKVDPIYYYRYSQTLKTVGDNNKANEYRTQFESYISVYENKKNCSYDIQKSENNYIIENVGINSVASDYGSSVYNGMLIFTSTRKHNDNSEKDNWTSDYYSSIYAASISTENKLSNYDIFAKELKAKYHITTPVFSKDGGTMYFTMNYLNKKEKGDIRNQINLKIYKSTFENGKWVNITELPFNSDTYSCANPALSIDGKTLFFASDMPGGYGESDIYKVTLLDDGNYSSPQNLGDNINTIGRDNFPFVSDDNYLYFSSDYHSGLGGVDIFKTSLSVNGFKNAIENIGYPINSPFDDFCYFKSDGSDDGFFSSNRPGGIGKDDIYHFKKIMKSEDQIKIDNLSVTDKDTQGNIENLTISVYDKNHQLLKVYEADSVKNFSTVINDRSSGSLFYLEIKSKDYETQELKLDKGRANNLMILLSKITKAFTKGTDLSKLILNPIFFNLNKDNITVEAETELQKIVQILKDFPTVKISIQGHTDSRQSFSYNMKLSERRAKSIMNYIVSNGIQKERVSFIAYGESRLLNKCADGIPCSEEEHKLNRRCEFIVTEM